MIFKKKSVSVKGSIIEGGKNLLHAKDAQLLRLNGGFLQSLGDFR